MQPEPQTATPPRAIHGLYAQNPSLRATVDDAAYAALRENYHAVWKPANIYLADKVDDLVAIRWELNRLREVRRQFLARVFNDVATTFNPEFDETSVVTQTEIRANEQSGAFDRLDLRIRRCQLEISRIERDIVRTAKFFAVSGPSQNLLKTNEVEPEKSTGNPKAAHKESPPPSREAGFSSKQKLAISRSKRRQRRSNWLS